MSRCGGKCTVPCCSDVLARSSVRMCGFQLQALAMRIAKLRKVIQDSTCHDGVFCVLFSCKGLLVSRLFFPDALTYSQIAVLLMNCESLSAPTSPSAKLLLLTQTTLMEESHSLCKLTPRSVPGRRHTAQWEVNNSSRERRVHQKSCEAKLLPGVTLKMWFFFY